MVKVSSFGVGGAAKIYVVLPESAINLLSRNFSNNNY